MGLPVPASPRLPCRARITCPEFILFIIFVKRNRLIRIQQNYEHLPRLFVLIQKKYFFKEFFKWEYTDVPLSPNLSRLRHFLPPVRHPDVKPQPRREGFTPDAYGHKRPSATLADTPSDAVTLQTIQTRQNLSCTLIRTKDQMMPGQNTRMEMRGGQPLAVEGERVRMAGTAARCPGLRASRLVMPQKNGANARKRKREEVCRGGGVSVRPGEMAHDRKARVNAQEHPGGRKTACQSYRKDPAR